MLGPGFIPWVALLFFVSLFGCQDVIEIDPAGEEPRLVFDAILRVNVDTPNENRINISTTNSFFDEIHQFYSIQCSHLKILLSIIVY